LEEEGQWDLAQYILDDVDYVVLEDIKNFLKIPHLFQEVLAAEKTPTLALALPMYERAIIMLDKYAIAAPRLAHAIGATRGALVEYMRKSRKSRIYALAMSPCARYHATLMLTHAFQFSILRSSSSGSKTTGIRKKSQLRHAGSAKR
jgi:hypothetical protein